MSLIWINKNKCKKCYTCVRTCPVKAISYDNKEAVAEINPDRCILCGNCFVSCAANAVEFKDDTETVKKLVAGKNKTVAIVAPSIAAEFPDVTDYKNFVGMIRSLGFDYVSEVSFAADMVARKTKSTLKNAKGKYYITANCPPVIDYIRKFQPELIPNLMPLKSPMLVQAQVMQKLYGKHIKIVYIGPCIAQKKEAEQYAGEYPVHAVLTFYELRKLFRENNILENSVKFSEFDPPFGRKGSLYPLSSGILKAANTDENPLNNRIMTIEGKNAFKPALDDFGNIPAIKHHLNIFYCEGCAMGPGTTMSNIRKLQRQSLVVNYAAKRMEITNEKDWKTQILKFSKTETGRTYEADDQRVSSPDKNNVKEVLTLLGKDKPMNINCGQCGYESCHDFAVDVAKGLTKPEMCINFILRNRQEYIDKLTQSNKKLAKTQEALRKSEQIARKDHEAVKEAMAITTSMMQKLPSGVVLLDKNMKIVQSNNRFINLLGEEALSINEVVPGLKGADIKTLLPYNVYNMFSYVLSTNKPILNRDITINNKMLNISVFTIKRKDIVGGVIRDLHEPAVRSDEVITRLREVIDKNLEMVQQIGFLLGEGASDTEKRLNAIIETFESDNKKDNN